jgi:hypothetical protein
MSEYIDDETTLTADIRAHVAYQREKGLPVDKWVVFTLAIADLLRLPDDTLFVPAVCAAMETQTQLQDPASIARTRDIAIAAGYGRPQEHAGLA